MNRSTSTRAVSMSANRRFPLPWSVEANYQLSGVHLTGDEELPLHWM